MTPIRNRIPRKPTARAASAVSARLARRRDARAPRVVVKDRGGHTRALAGDDPAVEALVRAAVAVLAAAER